MPNNNKVIMIMGPTASGKTAVAMQLAQMFPIDIISVDSAMIYRGMDIGTGKPTKDELKQAPHQLIDMLDPAESYSVAQFCSDAVKCIEVSHANNRVPVLVGGTMMYFNALLNGIHDLPSSSSDIREQLDKQEQEEGLASLYAQLQTVDPTSAERIKPNDQQRIKRALEVVMLTGQSLTDNFDLPKRTFLDDLKILKICITPKTREEIHNNIEVRFEQMLEQGFIAEVERLKDRSDLHEQLSSIRCVGYRQVWDYLSGNVTLDVMKEKAVAATRQLAKRQVTWLRKMDDLNYFESSDQKVFEVIKNFIS